MDDGWESRLRHRFDHVGVRIQFPKMLLPAGLLVVAQLEIRSGHSNQPMPRGALAKTRPVRCAEFLPVAVVVNCRSVGPQKGARVSDASAAVVCRRCCR